MRGTVGWLMVVAAVAATGCDRSADEAAPRAGPRVFEFSSGGAQHPAGHGAWKVRLTSAGELSVWHVRGEKVSDCGGTVLGPEENESLWRLIDGADLEHLESSTRLGVPDEARHHYRLETPEGVCTADVWVGEARSNDRLNVLVDQLGALVRRQTGREAVLW